jgi:DNA modification methylase
MTLTQIKKGPADGHEQIHEVALVDLAVIAVDPKLQPRAKLNKTTTAEYAQAMRDGASFPPVVVFRDGDTLRLVDGFHRYQAAKAVGAAKIEAEIRYGSNREALWYAMGANATHGLRRTNADKRRAVIALLEDAEWVRKADVDIARHCGVSSALVGNLREELGVKGFNSRAGIGRPKRKTPTAPMTDAAGSPEVEHTAAMAPLDEVAESERDPSSSPALEQRRPPTVPTGDDASAQSEERTEAERPPAFQGTLYRGDCREVLQTLPEGRAQLITTSPPYNTGWNYGDGGAGDRRPLPEYLDLLAAVLGGCYRVLRPGGILALNLPPSIRVGNEHRAWPLAAWAQEQLRHTGWLLREPLMWLKAQQNGIPYAASTAFGGPSNPYLRPTHELVLLASKGDYRLTGKKSWPQAPDGYINWLKDTWVLPPGRARRGDPLAFPDELVSRLIQLYSEIGNVVLDPFAGTGTVGRLGRALGREVWLIERESAYWQRLEALLE